MPTATTFYDYEALYWHFRWHGADFGAAGELDYLNECCTFLNAVRTVNTDIQECERVTKAEIIRFNAVNDYFAVMDTSGIILTFFKPMPIHLAPVGYSGITHSYLTNQVYFEENCRR